MGRDTVDGARKIELSWLKTKGFISPDISFKSGNLQWSRHGEPTGDINIQVDTSANNPHIRLTYRSRDWWEKSEEAWVSRDYQFPLEKIPCRYGGYKWFVRCQLSKNGVFCGRRVRILYSVGGYYGCRHCASLTYESCNQSGRYKGFISIPDLEEQEAKIGRRYYAGKPTRKYLRLLKMERQFNNSFLAMSLRFMERNRGKMKA